MKEIISNAIIAFLVVSPKRTDSILKIAILRGELS